MAATGVGTNRRLVLGTGLILAGFGILFSIDKQIPLQIKTIRSTGARYKGQKTVLYSAGTYYVTLDDNILAISNNPPFAANGALNIVLPTIGPNIAAGGEKGREIIIIDVNGVLGTLGNTITVSAAAGETINGAASVPVTGAFQVATVYYIIQSNGSNGGTGWIRKQ